MEAQKLLEDPKYYKTKPDDLFEKHSIYGLSLEGIKKYCSSPDNFRYQHQELVKESIRKKVENYMKMKNSKKINKVQEKYDHLNENINILFERIKKYNSQTQKKIAKKNLHLDTCYNNTEENFNKNMTITTNNKKTSQIKVGKYPKLYPSLEKTSKKKLPGICPRPVIVNYCLTYSNDLGKKQNTKFTNGYKNLGFSSYYMGKKYNPYNYDLAQKNRIARNVFGTLYCH